MNASRDSTTASEAPAVEAMKHPKRLDSQPDKRVLIEAAGLTVSIGGHAVCKALDWRVQSGERWAILGRNGAGKSTLLATLAGLRGQNAGTLTVTDIPLSSSALDLAWTAKALAKRRAYLAQRQSDPFASTVMETVLVGRHPHLGRWDWESDGDRAIARAALAAMELTDFTERDVLTLSGGERQRLAVAQLLAQQAELLLLDEPLTHLDLSHQVAVMDKLCGPARDSGTGIVAVLHDPGFAARYCDHALLLFGDGSWQAGPGDEVITAETLTRLYGHPLRELVDAGRRWFVPV